MDDTGPGRAADPPRPGWTSGVPRAVLVVALVAGAALTLQAREGLDWEELADPVRVRWARAVVGTVVVLMLASLARSLLRRALRPRRPAPSGERAEPEGEPFPVLLRVLAVVLVLTALAASWWVIDAVGTGLPDPRVAPPATGDPGQDAPPPLSGPHWPTLLGVTAVLVSVAVVSRLRAVRRDVAVDPAGGENDVEPDAAVLAPGGRRPHQ